MAVRPADSFRFPWDDDSSDDVAENLENTPENNLLRASESGDKDLVKKILQEYPSAIQASDSDSYSPLHRASYNDHPEIIQILLNAGASISARTVDGWLPLHSAARWNNHRCITLLCDAGSDLNGQTNSGQTALHLAAANLRGSETQSLEALLSRTGIDTSAKNSNGETAKILAERCGPYAHFFTRVKPYNSQNSEVEKSDLSAVKSELL